MVASFINRIGSLVGFKYDALDPKGKRRSVPRSVHREDYHTRGSKRTGLQSNAADLARNLSLAAWMVRRHLDYVSQFRFHSRTDNNALDKRIEALMSEHNRPAKADVAGRLTREKLFRLAEARRVLDGDTFLVKRADGRLQGIQGDLVKDPPEINNGEDWISGVLVNGVGRPLSYGVYARRSYAETNFLRRIRSTNVLHYGFFDRYASDQVRGISPLVSALNPLRDVYENFDYALAKAKVSHIFALSIYRDMTAHPEEEEELGEDGDGEASVEREPYNFDLSKPNILTLDEGDRAEVLESRQPSSEFQDFTKLVIQVSLKALDIPYSFYDESATNFFGSRAAWLHYERSCSDKRADQIELRRQYTIWKLRQWIASGDLALPRGMSLADIGFEWIPVGMPWFDPSKEIRGHVSAIGAGLDTPQRVCQATGTDFYDNVDQIAKAKEYAEKAGVDLAFVLEQAEAPETGSNE